MVLIQQGLKGRFWSCIPVPFSQQSRIPNFCQLYPENHIFPVPHPMSRFWRILLPQDQWNPTSCQDILRFPKPALYFGQISDSKITLQEPDTGQTAMGGRKPSGPASHLTCGEVFIMITFIAVLTKIGHWVYAPVTVKPQGRGIRHTQDGLTFLPIFMSNLIFYTRGVTQKSNTSF